VSALCAVWNGARFLREALASALAQTCPPDELIVVDDGSNDGSAEIAEALGLRVVREPHRGVAPTRNSALAHARGDLVAWLDADDRWTPDKLAVQVAYMNAHPEVGMTFTHQRLVMEPGVARPYWVRPEMLGGSSPVVGTCSMVVRRHLFDEVGGFDPTKTPSDDTDWVFRATQRGIAHVTLPETLLVRRVHAENLSTVKPLDRKLVLGMLRDSIARSRADRTEK
jgi:glycosyltransferase involved in cell wall biosynthesis